MENSDDSAKESSSEEEKNDEVDDITIKTHKYASNEDKVNSSTLKIKAKNAAQIQDERAIHNLELMQYSLVQENDAFDDKNIENSDSELNKTINSSEEEDENEHKIMESIQFAHKKSIFSKKTTTVLSKNEEISPQNNVLQMNKIFKDKLRTAIQHPDKEESEKIEEKSPIVFKIPSKEEVLTKLISENKITFRNSENYQNNETIAQSAKLKLDFESNHKRQSSLLMRRSSSKNISAKSMDLDISPSSKMKEDLKKIKISAQNCSYKYFLMNHYVSWELNGIKLVINSLKNTNNKAKILISNISATNGAFLIRTLQKQKNDLKIYAETSIPYLYFHSDMIKKGEGKFKGSPPIRDEENRNLLIAALQVPNLFHSISSFHLQVPTEYKNIEKGNFKRCFNGFSIIGLNLQIVWTKLFIPSKKKFKTNAKENYSGVKKEIINQHVKKIIALMCENPSNLIGLKNKGVIKSGNFADFVVWDPFKIEEINDKMIFLKYKKNFLLRNHKVYGHVSETFLRGKCVYSAQKQCFEKNGKILFKSV